MRVETSGSWTITIKPLSSARLWTAGSTATGKGDDVLLVESPPSGLVTSRITHQGDSNFAVWVYTVDGDRDLVVNEIGNYSGEVQILSGTVLVAVTSEGTWSITSPT
jgi:hypothetical protein